MIWETHSHTPLCRHAVGNPTDLAEAAAAKGLMGLIITCHGPLPNGISAGVRMRDSEFPEYVRLVREAQEVWEGRLDVRLGLESDFLPGLESWVRELHQRAEFHYILGSVHPQLEEYKELYWSDDWRQFARGYFLHLAEAAETGLYDCLSHPDLVKNLVVPEWDLEAIWPSVLEALDRIAETETAMELNTSGLSKKLPEMNPSPAILSAMRERNIRVVIGADAHCPERVADEFKAARNLLRAAGYEESTVFLERTPMPVSLEEEQIRPSSTT